MSEDPDRFAEATGKLRRVERLTDGAYLSEYDGVLTETGDDVRVITLAPGLAEIEAAVDAFTRVTDQWYNASANANIRPIRERGTEPRPWIAVADGGETLATAQADLSPDAIGAVVAETAEALRTLGLYNTVHGRLSPDDVHLFRGTEEEGLTVELGGFGLEAAVRAAVDEFEPTAYTAPELVDGSTQPSERTDVYGLGAVTYFALTGQQPIDGGDLAAAVRDGPTTPPSTHADGVGADIDDVVMQALAASPTERYESPYAFRRAFLTGFDPDTLGPDDTSDDGAETADSADFDGATDDDAPSAPDSDTQSEPVEESTASDGTDGRNTTRRGAVGLLGAGVIGGAGWVLFRGPLSTAGLFGHTAAPGPAEPSASLTVTPAGPSVSEEVTFSATESTAGEGASIDTYEWAIGEEAEFAIGDETHTETFSDTGEHTVRLRVTDSRDRTATDTTTVTVEPPTVGAPMFQYNAANTGANPAGNGPETAVVERWAYETGNQVGASPAVVDGTVYVGSYDGAVYALSASDGTEQWTVRTGDRVLSSPAVVDGTVHVGSENGTVYALSASDGAEQWTVRTGDRVLSSPTVVDGTVYVGSDDESVYALSATDGTEQWSYRTGSAVLSSPAVVGGTVYVGSNDGSVYALSAADGTVQWSFDTGRRVASSPAVVDGTVYVGSDDDAVYALSADGGTEQWRFETGGLVQPSPAVVGGTVYVGSLDGSLYALSAVAGTEQWRFDTGDGVYLSAAVVDGTVYAGSGNGDVYALSTDDGAEQWSFPVGVDSTPTVVDGTVYVGSRDGNVYALSA